MNDFDDIEEKITDIDEIVGTDIKINPDYYIHNAILKAQTALTKDNVKDGVIQFFILVEHIENLCSAAKLIPLDYKEKLEEYTGDKESTVGMARIANYKLKLLMSEVFNSKVLTQAMKI